MNVAGDDEAVVVAGRDEAGEHDTGEQDERQRLGQVAEWEQANQTTHRRSRTASAVARRGRGVAASHARDGTRAWRRSRPANDARKYRPSTRARGRDDEQAVRSASAVHDYLPLATA